jgi:ribosome-associated toxin RatA of RatAB toxin-antitoxin module
MYTQKFTLDAELQVGFKLFHERYTSRVEMSPHRFVKACATNTPMFRILRNEWYFSQGPTADSCLVDFLVEYQFHNRWYAQVSPWLLWWCGSCILSFPE